MLDRIFDPENGFWQLMTKLYKVCALSVIWFLCCIPIVTAGAATAAFFDYALSLAENREGKLLQSFWRSFVVQLRHTTMAWLLLLLAAVILTVNILFLISEALPAALGFPLLAVSCFASVVWACTLLFFPFVQVKKRLCLWKSLRYSALMAVRHFPFTVLMMLALGLFLFLSWKFPFLSVLLIGIGMFVNTYILKYMYDRYPG